MPDKEANERLIDQLGRSILEHLQGDDPITLLVVGRIGSGKSSTVNSLLGAELANVSLHGKGTDNVEMHEGEIQGIKFKVIDTPGFGDPDPDQDARTLEQINRLAGHFDALLYVSALNQPRVDLIDTYTMRTLFESLPDMIWDKSVIVLTKADLTGESFAAQRGRWERTLRDLMAREARRTRRATGSDVEKIPMVAVSNGHPRNPDGNEWLGELFVTALERINRTVAIRFLFAQIKRVHLSDREQSTASPGHATSGGPSPAPAATSYSAGWRAESFALDPAQRGRLREVVRDALVITASATTIGAAVGAAVGGPPGALVGGFIGATIGVTVAAVTTFWDGVKGLFS